MDLSNRPYAFVICTVDGLHISHNASWLEASVQVLLLLVYPVSNRVKNTVTVLSKCIMEYVQKVIILWSWSNYVIICA